MLQLGLAACVFVMGLPSDDAKAIGKLAQQFAVARQHKDRAGMERVLHPDYLGHALPRWGGDKMDMSRAEAVAMWTDPDRLFRHLSYKTWSVRVLGGTAIETGELGVDQGWKGSTASHIYGGVKFVRVWMKDQSGWRVVHESY